MGNRWRWCAAVFLRFGELLEELSSYGGGSLG